MSFESKTRRYLLPLLLLAHMLVACGGKPPNQPVAEDDGERNPSNPAEADRSGSETRRDSRGGPVIEPTLASLNRWDESATWTKFNSALELTWRNPGGDWIDAEGAEQGSKAFATVELVDDNQPGPVNINVLPAIQTTGKADFLVRRQGGTAFTFNSREADRGKPVLVLNDTTILVPVADTRLNDSTTKALGTGKTLSSKGAILIRFELPENAVIDQAVLRLESTGAEYGNQTLQVFATDAKVRTIARPAWLQNDSTLIASFDGDDVLRSNLPVTVANGIAHSTLSSPNLTWINANKIIPGQTSACATVYQKLGADFKPGDGGKHPGFSNTGDSRPGSDVVNGITYSNSGWGGRSPDGVHWSARTGYGSWTETHVASHTYFYAMDPHNAYGWVDPIGHPFPKGQWSAYVQCVGLNTVTDSIGNNDGKLYYEISGIGPVYSREDIRWRDIDAPESQIREFWINYYCGGTSCGDIPTRGTVSFAKAVITKGLPDMAAVAAEVDRLRREHP